MTDYPSYPGTNELLDFFQDLVLKSKHSIYYLYIFEITLFMAISETNFQGLSLFVTLFLKDVCNWKFDHCL